MTAAMAETVCALAVAYTFADSDGFVNEFISGIVLRTDSSSVRLGTVDGIGPLSGISSPTRTIAVT